MSWLRDQLGQMFRAEPYRKKLKHDVGRRITFDMAGTALTKINDSTAQPLRDLSRLALGIKQAAPMENENPSTPGDSPWQSVRLGFGAVLLILSGLGLFLLDSSSHTSTAHSSTLVARTR